MKLDRIRLVKDTTNLKLVKEKINSAVGLQL